MALRAVQAAGGTLARVGGAVDVRVLDADGVDEVLLSRLTDVVNAAYAVGEDGMWCAGVRRTDRDALATIAARGELAVARSGGAVAGCVRVHDVAGDTCEVGLLATDPSHQGHGLGTALMDHAEERARAVGRANAGLDLLVPAAGTHPAKERLAAWYARRGYAVVDRVGVGERYPHLVDDLAVPCDVLLWRKPL